MDWKEFREHGHRLVDWMSDFMETIEERRVVPETRPGDIRAKLPTSPPQKGEPFPRIFEEFQSLIVPGMTLWNHPGWFAYFPANHSPPSILAEMLMATLGAQCMSWQTSPAATELEQTVLVWLRSMLGLSGAWTGSLQDTASTSTLVAMLSAREKVTSHRFGMEGAGGVGEAPMVVYASDHAHSSIDKAVKLAGLGLQNLHRIAVDETFAMRADALESAILADKAQGKRPTCVVATVGTTSSTAMDPLVAIGEVCQRHGVWLHVDAAYAGSAAILPEQRAILDGVELADSFVFNPHKWLFTNFDCSVYYVKDVDLLLRTFKSNPEYLKTVYDPEVVNYRDWGIQLGRRFRALKLWFVLRSYGVEGLQERLRNHIAWGKELASWVKADDSFALMAPAPVGLVCFRHVPSEIDESEQNEWNEALLRRVNGDGRFHLTHTKLDGKMTIRLVVGQLSTTYAHVQEAWAWIQRAAREQLEERNQSTLRTS